MAGQQGEGTATRPRTGERVVYTGPCRDVGGVRTGTAGVVERVTESGDVAEVRWDVVDLHAVSWKDRWYLRPETPGAPEAAGRPAAGTAAKPRAAS